MRKTLVVQHSLVVVGHSLGAGTATILALLLRNKYPSLKCYAYGYDEVDVRTHGTVS